ncbi:2-keto-4-pentenoate hydratase/2-oxohepta-3-ene-1,7-dioic acid hydratase in catechol pathway [Kribbella sp. VKM Ac-2527]|uniref:2-keto-4-pentenoate hydratase/2-oxohepta-3-ene-1,7-dioic acid hydratase in catechol pathway n=1 Tax=Kribbella caucasensis TaxID=2512215 RepID=A0A4R6KPS6_9ACTN|nr:fumarylacetoacetate hydrolase family protein [Kribbella sp. VKM Ac-2527]TDO54685.1 2-keto-4-pentenoate hydratase/2-oxohepta-3-ene-1,7-dioic acid hydratase in catechol pathway [Kribbella sp. VKM Ac-2527]
MELLRLGAVGEERPYVRAADGTVYDLTSVTRDTGGDIDGTFLASDGIARARAALEAGSLPAADVEGLRIGAPIAKPSAVVCIGQNYAAHAAESGAQPPKEPIVFFKHPNTVVGPYDEVLVPRGSARTDWEVELAVVIGKTARYLSSDEEALACIAGYAVSNDVSERAFQLEVSGGQWSKGKCCETFNPLGPVLVPADEVEDPQALDLKSWVNGEPRQASNTRDMIFSVATLVRDLSQYMTLDPGDIVNTGTPEGVALSGRFPYLAPGDTVECEIAGLGRQKQTLGKG